VNPRAGLDDMEKLKFWSLQGLRPIWHPVRNLVAMEAIFFSETLVDFQRTERAYIQRLSYRSLEQKLCKAITSVECYKIYLSYFGGRT
jgi:hypothetical protein